ncbi:hypothetical protein [Kineococcus terrestris]|uniref:hypothetical protein n=1 Tax=Kineococcus terrestris TaxID=2044856 RepID=UPI0034DB7341
MNLDILNERIAERMADADNPLDFTSIAYDEAVALGLAESDDGLVVRDDRIVGVYSPHGHRKL